mmetsp:Transcript_20367/g.51287  ORF Transcript_20367/g.51287 Transcript_20367/m.51287 type:complete len:125 (-) Transcript_20367:98-472(-)
MAASTTPAVFNVDVNPPVVAPEFKVEDTEKTVEISSDMKDNPISNLKLGLTQDRILTIVGEQTAGTSDEEQASEKKVPYQRAVPLPPAVDETNITAKMTQEGELKLCMPKHVTTETHSQAVGAC